MKQVFESENIRFVAVSEPLVQDYLIMVNDIEHVEKFIGGWHEPFTEEQEIRWVQKKLAEKVPVFSMLEKKSSRFIGNVELMDIADGVGELGIAITAEMQDRGFGTEAVRAITEYGIKQLNLHRVFLRTNPDNRRAIRVYEKCGFREYDRTAEHVFMEYAR
jgi:diamine N-acetyltransferase